MYEVGTVPRNKKAAQPRSSLYNVTMAAPYSYSYSYSSPQPNQYEYEYKHFR
jgi:hypothetical protein